MKRTQHTPRPWLVKPVAAPMSHNGDIGVVTAKGELIAVALLERGRAAANARLIAAAPQLFDIAQRVEALLTRQHWMPDGDSPESALLRDVRAAILRVEGEGA